MKLRLYFVLISLAAGNTTAAQLQEGRDIELPLRTRVDGQPVERRERIDPQRIGIVVIDVWDYHWCMTCTHRVAAMTPRMNRAFDGARRLGMQVIFAPTNGIAPYEDWPQRQAVKELRDHPWPRLRDVSLVAGGGSGGPCMCGPGIDCKLNYGMKALHPDLRIDERDLIAWGTREMYNICRERELTHLIYSGTATNMCVVGKPEAAAAMTRLGLTCFVDRELTDPFGYPPAVAQQGSIEFIEAQGVPSVSVIETLRDSALWDDAWPVDPVEIRPWGKTNRPYFFDDRLEVYLEHPRQRGVVIRYTLDGSDPSSNSEQFKNVIALNATTTLRTQAFRDGDAVGLPSEAYYVKRAPAPPRPDLRLWELQPLKVIRPAEGSNELDCPLQAWGLQLRGKSYLRGIALHAPASAVYEIKPEYERFVALAGVDDIVLGRNLGETLARYPSVVFRVHIDDELAAESPVMRISEPPWHFDFSIPKGSKRLKLEVTDAGDGARLDLGLWPESGFVIPGYQGPRNVP